jgi:predicted peptidase
MRPMKVVTAWSLIAVVTLSAGNAVAQRSSAAGGAGAPDQRNQPAAPRGAQPVAGSMRSGIEIRSYRFEPTGQQMKYGVFLPRKLDKKTPAPLVIALHGYGGQPESILSTFAPAAGKHGYIVAAPMGYTRGGWYGFSRDGVEPVDSETARRSELDVMNVLDIMRATYNIDPRRIYIAGHSMGGLGAVYLAVKHPQIWAAVAAMSPGFTPEALKVQGLGVYAAAPVIVEHGDQDELIPAELVRNWVAGVKARNVTAIYNEYRGGGHNAPLLGGADRVFDFFDKHSRPQAATAP